MPTCIPTANRLGEVKEYYFATKLREIQEMQNQGKPVLNLGIGSPDLPPPADVVEEMADVVRLPDNHGYQSYQGLPALRQAFADWYRNWFDVHLDGEQEVLPLMGSKEGIMHISMTFLEAGDEVLVPNPGYPAYRAVAQLTGATVRMYELSESNNWYPNLSELEASDLSRVKIMWLNYPHMPTGTPASAAFFEDVVAFAHRHRILICNDNPYAFVLNDKPVSLLNIAGAKEVAIELNSLSKAHNMAGWRIGMMAGKGDHLKAVLRFKTNMDSGMFKPLQLAAVKALHSPPSWYRELNAVYRERRERVFDLLEALGCTFSKNQVGMFVWAKIPDHYGSGFELSDKALYDAHVFITPGGIFGSQGDRYIRISLCSSVVVYEEALRRIIEKKVGLERPKNGIPNWK